MAQNKTGFGTVLFHLFLIFATGGLWLIFLVVRALLDARKNR